MSHEGVAALIIHSQKILLGRPFKSIGRGFEAPPYLLLTFYFALIVIVLGLTSSDFGSVTVKMPFSKSAFALSEITPVGCITERSKAPLLFSRMFQALSFFSSSYFVSPLMVTTG